MIPEILVTTLYNHKMVWECAVHSKSCQGGYLPTPLPGGGGILAFSRLFGQVCPLGVFQPTYTPPGVSRSLLAVTTWLEQVKFPTLPP